MTPAELITREDDTFISLEGMRQSLRNDDELLLECAAMLKICHEKGNPWKEGVQNCIANFITRHGMVIFEK